MLASAFCPNDYRILVDERPGALQVQAAVGSQWLPPQRYQRRAYAQGRCDGAQAGVACHPARRSATRATGSSTGALCFPRSSTIPVPTHTGQARGPNAPVVSGASLYFVSACRASLCIETDSFPDGRDWCEDLRGLVLGDPVGPPATLRGPASAFPSPCSDAAYGTVGSASSRGAAPPARKRAPPSRSASLNPAALRHDDGQNDPRTSDSVMATGTGRYVDAFIITITEGMPEWEREECVVQEIVSKNGP